MIYIEKSFMEDNWYDFKKLVRRKRKRKYYVPTQIQAMTVSAVYNSDDMYDVTFIVNGVSEPSKNFPI